MKMPANHFDFGAIFPQLSGLEEFYVCYKVEKVVTDKETDGSWEIFSIS